MTPPHRHEERPVAALLAPDILALLDESPGDVAAETEELHPANLADIAEALPIERVPALLRALPPARAADVLEYLDEELRSDVLEAMSVRQAAELVSQMTPDDRADALEEMEERHADEILSEIPTEARGETERLLAWPPESAGGLMTTEFVSVPQALTVDEALRIGTIHGARASYEEATKGSITAGKLADLVVWARDPLTVPLADLPDIPAELTMIGGQIVHRSGALA